MTTGERVSEQHGRRAWLVTAAIAVTISAGAVSTAAAPERRVDDAASVTVADALPVPAAAAVPVLPTPLTPMLGGPPSEPAGRLLPGTTGAPGIPAAVRVAYERAAARTAADDAGCGLTWDLLAGIGRIESGHASGGRVDAAGTTRGRILGPRLDGTLAGTARILDTDGGALDGDAAFDRAVGPMQFIPGTWAGFAAEGNDDGARDPHNVHDAALAAARYLCAGAGNLSTHAGVSAALFRYNRSVVYGIDVLAWARAYRTGGAPVVPAQPGPVPAPQPSGAPVSVLAAAMPAADGPAPPPALPVASHGTSASVPTLPGPTGPDLTVPGGPGVAGPTVAGPAGPDAGRGFGTGDAPQAPHASTAPPAITSPADTPDVAAATPAPSATTPPAATIVPLATTGPPSRTTPEPTTPAPAACVDDTVRAAVSVAPDGLHVELPALPEGCTVTAATLRLTPDPALSARQLTVRVAGGSAVSRAEAGAGAREWAVAELVGELAAAGGTGVLLLADPADATTVVGTDPQGRAPRLTLVVGPG